VTTRNIYVFGAKEYAQAKRVMRIVSLAGIINASSSEELVICMKSEHDLHLKASTEAVRTSFIEMVAKAFADLDKSSKFPLPVIEEEEVSLEKYVCHDTEEDLSLKSSLQTRFLLERKSIAQAHRQSAVGAAVTLANDQNTFKFDLLDIARVSTCVSFINKAEGQVSEALFSDTISRVSERGARSSRSFVMTSKSLYSFKDHSECSEAQPAIAIQSVEGLVRSSSSSQLILMIDGAADLLLEFQAANRVGFFVQVLQEQFKKAKKRTLLVHTMVRWILFLLFNCSNFSIVLIF
jgi:hypothetical protein